MRAAKVLQDRCVVEAGKYLPDSGLVRPSGSPWKERTVSDILRPSRRHSLIVGALVLAISVTACSEPTVSEQAAAKAQELESKVSGLSSGSAGVLFAEDGGHLCAAADNKDHLALVALTPNGFALRKLEVDKTDVEFARSVIDVYCPENRQTFDDYVSSLKVSD